MLFILTSIIVMGVVASGLILPQEAMAASKHYAFTQTVTSSLSPGWGHEIHQLSTILPLNEGTIYTGTITYASSAPVQIMVLHEIGPDDARGQPTWTVDGETFYGFTLIKAGSAGTFDYTGASLALHNSNGTEFVATVSVDGWVRGEQTEITLANPVPEKEEPTLRLGLANVPATIPMHAAYHDSGQVMYIVTDASDADWAEKITEAQTWNVELAPPLADAPDDMLNTMYVFTNGIPGEGLYGYQDEVFAHTPDMDDYNAISRIVEISWKPGQNQETFEYASDITDAIDAGRVNMKDEGIVANTPHIMWPDGQMPVRDSPDIVDHMPYGGGQITDIDTEEMTVTFVAHRGWGPDGRTIYYIVTDSTPTPTADGMGVVDAPSNAQLIANSAAVDLFQFGNGIVGTGPMGFQPGIATSALGDDTYSPMWRIFVVEWNDPEQALVLETHADINHYASEDMITTSIARPANADHIVNCPFIDPFQ